MVAAIESAGSVHRAWVQARQEASRRSGLGSLDAPGFEDLRRLVPASRGGTDASARAELLWEELVESARQRLAAG